MRRFILTILIGIVSIAAVLAILFFGGWWASSCCASCANNCSGTCMDGSSKLNPDADYDYAHCDQKSSLSPIEPGTYDFNTDNYNTFIYYETKIGKAYDSSDYFTWFERCFGIKKEFSAPYAMTSGAIIFCFHPVTWKSSGCNNEVASNLLFTDCVITVEVTINEKTQIFDIPLNSSGKTTYTCEMNIDTAHKLKGKAKIIDVKGQVFCPPAVGNLLYYNDFILKYNESNGQNYYSIVGFTNSPKTLVIPKYVDVGAGQVPIKPLSIFSYSRDMGKYPGQSLNNTETIIFDGDFDISDLISETYNKNDRTYVYNANWDLADGYTKMFASLKTIVIKNIHGGKEGYTIKSQMDFPDQGITFYVNDNSNDQIFMKILERSLSVNGIYGYNQYR